MSTTEKISKTSSWLEAVRLRTLPVSLAGVVTGASLAIADGCFDWLPAVICVVFATLAQIASNFANEYFDYKDGLDRKGRVGPRRGVTEGDITPRAMRNATFLTLGAAAAVGLSLIHWGGWWLLAAGAVIIAGALLYSTGPYPLSRHACGEVAVILFFGVVPVSLTYYLQAGTFTTNVWLTSVAIGLLGANVLIVNNYRDIDDDRAVGKHTLATKFGPGFSVGLYIFNAYTAVALMAPMWLMFINSMQRWGKPVFLVVLILAAYTSLGLRMRHTAGAALNPMLGKTARMMLIYCLLFLIEAVIYSYR